MSDVYHPAARGVDAPMPAGNRLAMVAVMLAVALATLDTAIANTALPAIAADLHATSAESVWVVNAYQLAMVATILPFAALGDVLGHRRVYIGGLALFTVASLACAAAPTLPLLAAARLLQGLGGSAITSVSIALVSALYPRHRLGRGVGVNALVVGVSVAVGPTIASLILSTASWSWLFMINVPLGLIGLAFALPALPRTAKGAHPFDPIAALLSVITFASLIFALGEGGQRAPAAHVFGALALALVFGAGLMRREAGRLAPMLPVDLLRRPVFALSAVTAVCGFAAQGFAFVSLPFYFEDVLHRSQIETGFLITPWPVVVAIVAPIAGRLSDRYPPGVLGATGLACLCAGLVSLALMPADPSVYAIAGRMALCGVGFGLFQSPNIKALMASAPHARSGGASGVVATSRLIGQATGAALVALCFGVAGRHGSTLALAGGAMFAGVGCIASGLRLLASSHRLGSAGE
ncbi:drug resistance transporter, EmrB/QacA subfamily [Burkholderia sp. YR290]|nr:drug resistance transporter, EmrB/QacA subfamily [Paraburkholderia hospita]SOE89614.1 drug resistance transporter, EmrB/QacA subfamily [Burkholderia sp. YR290]